MKFNAFLYLLLITVNMFIAIARADSGKIPIYVVPFYNSTGPEINVGDYSDGLNTDDAKKLAATVSKMAQEKDTLTPEQMYVAAIRLYELGQKDEAVYWYYEAQYRAKLFSATLKKPGGPIADKGFELSSAYGAFTKLAGAELNGYAGCDLDKWQNVVQKVLDSNSQSPDLQAIFPGVSFVAKKKWNTFNSEVSSGLEGLFDYLEKNRSTWKQQRAVNNADERFCN